MHEVRAWKFRGFDASQFLYPYRVSTSRESPRPGIASCEAPRMSGLESAPAMVHLQQYTCNPPKFCKSRCRPWNSSSLAAEFWRDAGISPSMRTTANLFRSEGRQTLKRPVYTAAYEAATTPAPRPSASPAAQHAAGTPREGPPPVVAGQGKTSLKVQRGLRAQLCGRACASLGKEGSGKSEGWNQVDSRAARGRCPLDEGRSLNLLNRDYSSCGFLLSGLAITLSPRRQEA